MDPQITSFLLQQLLMTWHLDVVGARTPNKLSKMQQLQTPPLIAILARLEDAPVTAHTPEGKILPCGHRVDVHLILSCSNFFGDLAWGKRGHVLECPHADCNDQYTLPMIPNPWVVDGLQARLDLIQWAWAHGKDAPNYADVKTGRMLRHILNQIGHLPLKSESTLRVGLSQRRIRQTLRLFDTEGVTRAVENIYAGPRLLRGKQPYCKFRPSKAPPPEYVQFTYFPPSPGQYCDLREEPHRRARGPRKWASTPAEDEEEQRFIIPWIEHISKSGKSKQKKIVRFAAPVVTAIQYFEPWWRDEYRDSDRYYSSGPSSTSADRSTKLDDDREIARYAAEKRLRNGYSIFRREWKR